MTFGLLFTGYSAMQSSAYDFQSSQGGYYFVKLNYHREMNEFFNEKIEALIETQPGDVNYSPPATKEGCTKENVSTYCVAMKALDIYDLYIGSLNSTGAFIGPSESDTQIPIVRGSLSDLFQLTTKREGAIEKEQSDALKLIDLTVSGYNELRLAYPMHERYKEIIVSLTRYRNFVEDLRIRSERFPDKFIDSTSSTCK